MESADDPTLKAERESALQQIESVLELPMNVLAFVWLLLTVLDLVTGLSPLLAQLTTIIWIVFWVDYFIKLLVAPDKLRYLRDNVLTLVALGLPALRLFRALNAVRFLRLLRGGRTFRLIATFNRGMRALRRSLRHRGFGYVVSLTFIVNILGAAGIYALERNAAYMSDFGTAIWWTAMMLTTMGSDFFPTSPEGRLLALLLATYGFAIFGYVTATVASFFVDRDAASDDSAVASDASVQELRHKLDEIQDELRQLRMHRNQPSSA